MQQAPTTHPSIPLPRPAWEETPGYEGTGYPVPRLSAAAPQSVSPAVVTPTRGVKAPRRSKGRLVVGSMLLTLVGVIVFGVWDSFLRYQAYGTVVGRVIQVSAPWDSQVEFWHVQEGDKVRQGQLLVTLDSPVLRQQLAKQTDELRLAQADLAARISQLQWEQGREADQNQQTSADYFEAWGALLQEQSKLSELQHNLQRFSKLRHGNEVSQADFDQSKFACEGQRLKIEKLSRALEDLKARAEQAGTGPRDHAKQLQPLIVKIETIETEITRTREEIERGLVRAPVHGLVVRRHFFGAEQAGAQKPLLSLLERGSLEVVLYLRQSSTADFQPGRKLSVVVQPYPDPISCQVTRVGDEFEMAPENLARYYRSHEKLLPIYVRPADEAQRWIALRVGGMAALPRVFSWNFGHASTRVVQE